MSIQIRNDQLVNLLRPEFASTGSGGISPAAMEGPGIDIVGWQIGLGGDSVLLYDSTGNPIAEYAATSAGLTAALAASADGDTVMLPSIIIGGDHTIPEGVTLVGITGSELSGSVTLSNESILYGVIIKTTGTAGVIGPASGDAIVSHCIIRVTNAAGVGVDADNGGKTYVRDCDIAVIGTNAIGVLAGVTGGGGISTLTSFGSSTGITHATPPAWEAINAPLWHGIGLRLQSAQAYGLGHLSVRVRLNSGSIPVGYIIKLMQSDDNANSGVIPDTPPAMTANTPGYALGMSPGDEVTLSGSASATWLNDGYFCITTGWGNLTYTAEILDIDWVLEAGGSHRLWSYASAISSLPIVINCHVEATGTNAIAVSIPTGSEAIVYWSSLDGTAYDLSNAGTAYVSNATYVNNLTTGTLTPLWSDRSAWDITNYAVRHASDINAGVLLRHLAAPSAAGNVMIDTGTEWTSITTTSNSYFWRLGGNADTDPATQYLGTSDARNLSLRTNGTEVARLSHADAAILIGDTAHGLGAAGTTLGLVTIGAHRTYASVVYGSGNPTVATGWKAGGTRLSPSNVSSGDFLGIFSGRGYSSGWPLSPNASVSFVADENFGTNTGARIEFRTTPTGNTTSGIHGTLRRGQWDVLYDPANYFRVIAGAAIGATPWTIPSNAAGWLHNDAAGGLAWSTPTAANVGAWGLTGNVLAGGEFLGSTNNTDLLFKIWNQEVARFYGDAGIGLWLSMMNSRPFSMNESILYFDGNPSTATSYMFKSAGDTYLVIQPPTATGIKVRYDTSNYFTATVSSAGLTTFAATGASAGFVFSNSVRINGGLGVNIAAPGAGIIDCNGVLSGSFYSHYRSGGWDNQGAINDATVSWCVALGGFRASQYQGVIVYANNAEVARIVAAGVGIGIGSAAVTSKLQIVGLATYANNAAAVAAGLTAGAFYRSNGDPDLVCVVH